MENQIFQLQYALDTFYFLVCGALVMWMAALMNSSAVIPVLSGRVPQLVVSTACEATFVDCCCSAETF